MDSSVSAALLKRQGYDVTGVFIKVWQPDWLECNWREERLDAMRAAAHIGIPFATLDLEREYKRGVVDYMIGEYAAGRTPNPDVMCNREVKFGAFWRWAKDRGADYIATGHYARNENGRLLVSADTNKDQTYFLWTLNRGDLEHALFPVGGMTKPETRRLAKKFGLANAGKKDSQGLCFMGKVDIKEFLRHYLDGEPAARQGTLLNEEGEKIGAHGGSLFFTVGERHGFAINPEHKTPSDVPYYVIGKDTANNTVTVSNKKGGLSPAAAAKVALSGVNWISGAPDHGRRLTARARYREPLKAGYFEAAGGFFEFDEPREAVAPGQSLVIYDEDGLQCLGGGVIQ